MLPIKVNFTKSLQSTISNLSIQNKNVIFKLFSQDREKMISPYYPPFKRYSGL